MHPVAVTVIVVGNTLATLVAQLIVSVLIVVVVTPIEKVVVSYVIDVPTFITLDGGWGSVPGVASGVRWAVCWWSVLAPEEG